MKKFSLALLALAVSLAVSPAAKADTWIYIVDGANLTADLTLYTNSNAATQTIVDVSGTFDITGMAPVTFGITPTENAFGGSAYNLTLSSDENFLFDNLLYTTASGNDILDWGGFLVEIDGNELNISSGAFGEGAPGDDYFYFSYTDPFYNTPILAPDSELVPAPYDLLPTPEPGSFFLLGTGVLGLALLLFRKAV